MQLWFLYLLFVLPPVHQPPVSCGLRGKEVRWTVALGGGKDPSHFYAFSAQLGFVYFLVR